LLTYKDNPERGIEVFAGDAVEDDVEHVVLLWIMKNKLKNPLWKVQVERSILKNRESGFYGNWISWDDCVKNKVEEGKLSANCLSYMDDGGGKPSGKLSGKYKIETMVALSPLKAKKDHCGHCFFKEETDKNMARKKSGYILDGIVCEGLDKNGHVERSLFSTSMRHRIRRKLVCPALRIRLGGVQIATGFCVLLVMGSIVLRWEIKYHAIIRSHVMIRKHDGWSCRRGDIRRDVAMSGSTSRRDTTTRGMDHVHPPTR
jgi:hypothetical protein